jgi:serine/threonine protein kinase
MHEIYNEFQILHRDIKPSNILTFSNNTIFKFSDFGSAKVNTLD